MVAPKFTGVHIIVAPVETAWVFYTRAVSRRVSSPTFAGVSRNGGSFTTPLVPEALAACSLNVKGSKASRSL